MCMYVVYILKSVQIAPWRVQQAAACSLSMAAVSKDIPWSTISTSTSKQIVEKPWLVEFLKCPNLKLLPENPPLCAELWRFDALTLWPHWGTSSLWRRKFTMVTFTLAMPGRRHPLFRRRRWWRSFWRLRMPLCRWPCWVTWMKPGTGKVAWVCSWDCLWSVLAIYIYIYIHMFTYVYINI